MVKRRTLSELERLRRRLTRLDGQSIDELYGLEPVWEPGTAPAGLAPEEFIAVRCPYCENYLSQEDEPGGQRSKWFYLVLFVCLAIAVGWALMWW